MMILRFGREEVTRTPDPYVPNVVRYQLRYFSKCRAFLDYFCKQKFSRSTCFLSKAGAKVLLFFDIRKLFCTFFAKSTLSGLNRLVFCHYFPYFRFGYLLRIGTFR